MYGEDVYSNPGKHGLEMVGEVEWDDEAYSFNLTAVWRDPQTGQLYWADDAGCSCPSPFEDASGRESLTAGTSDELGAHLAAQLKNISESEWRASEAPRAGGEVADLMLRVVNWTAPAPSGQ